MDVYVVTVRLADGHDHPPLVTVSPDEAIRMLRFMYTEHIARLPLLSTDRLETLRVDLDRFGVAECGINNPFEYAIVHQVKVQKDDHRKSAECLVGQSPQTSFSRSLPR